MKSRVWALLAAALAFTAIGGGTAFASYVVSSNSQIGPNTVSGHKPPSGKHANVIAGSLNAQDLAAGAVTTPKLAGSSVTGGKVKNGSISAFDLAAGVRLPQGCTTGEIAKRSATGWACATSTAPSGAAGGALAGTYPNPTLNVSGGDSGATACKNGEALTGLSASAALTCSPGVYSDGSHNVAAGPSPFGALTTGEQNVAVGPSMLTHDTTGIDNTAVGIGALSDDTSGSNNTANGGSALLSNTTGTLNAAFGTAALTQNTTGCCNAAIGYGALNANTSGFGNTALGQLALQNTTGSTNTALGRLAGQNLTTGSNNVDIANAGVAAESNTIRIGTQGTQTKAFLAGVSGTTTGATAAPVLVDANGQLGTTSSSRRVKRDIHPIADARKGLMALRPVSFRYRRSFVGGHSGRQFGLIAQQVARVYPNLVVRGRDGRPSAVAYQELPALELAQLQHQQARLHRQSKAIASLRRAVHRLAHR